jgi:hypothetical protein
MSDYQTNFGSLNHFQKGGVQAIADDPKNYAFSNIFEVASHAAPFERIAVAQNFEYVVEVSRAEGRSSWYSADHDEMVICMDGVVEINLVQPDAAIVAAGTQGAVQLKTQPSGRKMGRIVLGRGHMALLPKGAAYGFQAEKPSVLMIQTLKGAATVEKWADICQTTSS